MSDFILNQSCFDLILSNSENAILLYNFVFLKLIFLDENIQISIHFKFTFSARDFFVTLLYREIFFGRDKYLYNIVSLTFLS